MGSGTANLQNAQCSDFVDGRSILAGVRRFVPAVRALLVDLGLVK
jgi:hypothetical protein